jgi:hypothetical protein
MLNLLPGGPERLFDLGCGDVDLFAVPHLSDVSIDDGILHIEEAVVPLCGR